MNPIMSKLSPEDIPPSLADDDVMVEPITKVLLSIDLEKGIEVKFMTRVELLKTEVPRYKSPPRKKFKYAFAPKGKCYSGRACS